MNLEGPINLVGLLTMVFIGHGVDGGFRVWEGTLF
jgi:hypothetical protein